MRLTRLVLKRYGSFEDATLDFDPAPGRINLVLAPNGAGKSVLRAAFGDLLFGIGGQTPMGFRHGYAGMQLSATGVAADGTRFAFTRRKGNKNTLTGPDDAALDGGWLDRLLGRADRDLFAQLFALDTERLRQGGRDLLSSGGMLADALLAAAGGLREASALRRSLEEERDQLAPLRKTAQRPFYLALERWSDSRRLLRQSLVRPQQWLERETLLHEAERLRDGSNKAAAEAADRLRRLERVRRVRPLLARHAAATAWLNEHPDAPVLQADLAAQLPKARGAVAQAVHMLDTARGVLNRLDTEIAAIVPDDALLAQAEGIARLVEAAGLASQAASALPAAEAALGAAQRRVAEHLDALGRPDAIAHPADLAPSATLLAQLRRLMAEHAAHTDTAASFPRRLAEQSVRLAEAEQALAALPLPGDTLRLGEVLGEIRLEGDPVRTFAAAQRAVIEAEARRATTLARLPAALRDPEVLAALHPPDAAALERAAAVRDGAQAIQERRNETAQRAEVALATALGQQATLEAQGAPPSRSELATARTRRDTGWHLLFRRLSGEPPDRTLEHDSGGGQPLALAYAEAVAATDRIADARLADAEQATEAERLVRAVAEREAERDAARESLLAARTQANASRSTWSAVIRPLGLDAAASLIEVQRLLASREAGLMAQQEVIEARAALADVQARQDGAAGRLRQALDEPDLAGLPALLDRAEERVRQQRVAETGRQTFRAAATAARDALRGIEQEQAEAAERLARWQAGWDAALERLGHPPCTAPATLVAALEHYETLGEALREAASLTAQVAQWRSGLDGFRSDHAALCGTLGTPVDADAAAGVRALDRRLRAEAARAENQAVLLRQRQEDAAGVRQREAALAAAEAGLRAVIAAAGAATVEMAEQRIVLGTERVRQEGLRTAAAAELLDAGDGQTLEMLRDEVAAQPVEGLEAALDEAQAAQRLQAEQAQAQVAVVTELEIELRRMVGDDGAVQAASSEAAAASLLGQTLSDALLMQVAAGLLDTALTAVQEGGDDALLRRIGAAFAELTGDAYASVSSKEDERGMARLVVRPRRFPEEETTVELLSEGTRDQLFLALRLIAIEDHAAGGLVLPFVGDDILQSFDDQRSAAAFRALLRLSETAQVILLSHHEHLLEVLQSTLPASVRHIQRL